MPHARRLVPPSSAARYLRSTNWSASCPTDSRTQHLAIPRAFAIDSRCATAARSPEWQTPYLLECGSVASLRPSPSRLNASTVIMMQMPGGMLSQGAMVRNERASLRIEPQLGAGG